ncbi:MAG: alpha-amylase [Treponema sp.]|nr:alpha-amylase [Treponema sp.]
MLKRKILLSVLGFSMLSSFSFAKAKKAKEVDPVKAVNELAPVERKASKPSEGVYYSLFVRAFADGDGDGIGDFKGLIKKLDYLNDGDDLTTDDLGITGLWLLPIFESPSYHGYDVDDYYAVNHEYGTMEDFEKFLAECKKRGISVIIDMTCNHSSIYNDWFKQSKDSSSPYRNWYRWINDLDFVDNGGLYNRSQKGLAGNIWVIDLTNPVMGPDGQALKDRKGQTVMNYYAGLFSTGMPDYNLDEPAVRSEFKKVFKFWMDKGVDGFRFDAAGHAYNVAEVKPGSETITKSIAFWKEMNDYLVSLNPDTYSVCEVWEPTAIRARYMAGIPSNFHFDLGTLISQIINNQEANEDMNVPVDPDVNTYNGFARSLEGFYNLYKENNPNYIDAPFLSNHDQARSAASLQNKPAKIKMAADMYILAEGLPFIYYGEEIAMKSGSDDPSKRTPMVWAKDGKDKFTSKWNDSPMYERSNLYNRKTVSVKEQEKDPESILNHYKRIIRVKTAHPALFKGRLKAFNLKSPVLESYFMESEEESAFVVHNVSSKTTESINLPENVQDYSLVYAANPGVLVEDGKLTIPPLTSVVLTKNK